MLLGDFFLLIYAEQTIDTITAKLRFNKNHEIFKGHFPEQPVVPGVCMLQIIKEMIENSTGGKFILRSAESIKFLTVINPEVQNEVEARIQFRKDEIENLHVDASLFSGTLVFFKFNGTFKPE
mgnify:CR=1 FL=1